jgi:hypothetical protein
MEFPLQSQEVFWGNGVRSVQPGCSRTRFGIFSSNMASLRSTLASFRPPWHCAFNFSSELARTDPALPSAVGSCETARISSNRLFMDCSARWLRHSPIHENVIRANLGLTCASSSTCPADEKRHHWISLQRGSVFPSAVTALIDRAGLMDVPQARVAVIDGTAHGPRQPWKHGKQVVNTLWGELSWQLGGGDAFALVKESDAAGTSPGKDKSGDVDRIRKANSINVTA